MTGPARRTAKPCRSPVSAPQGANRRKERFPAARRLLASSGTNETIRYEPDERCPPLVSIGVGLQGVIFGLAPLVLVVAITASAGGQGESYLSWAVFAALIIAGVLTALQASRVWRLGAGHVLIMGATPNFVAVSVLALTEGGPPLLASLVVVASLFYIALAIWLPLLRRIITPVVSGTVLMLIAVTVLPIALDRVNEVPEGAPGFSGPIIAVVTLAVATGLALRGLRGVAALVSSDRDRRRLRGRRRIRRIRGSQGDRCAVGRHTRGRISRI